MSDTALRGRRLAAALATTFALTATACSGGETSDGDAAAYDNAEILAEMTDAVAAQDSVRLTLGTKQSPDDLTIDTTWGEDRAFRALTGGDPAQQLDVRLVADRVYLGGEVVGHQWTYLDVDDPRLASGSGFDAGPVPTLLDIDVVGDLEALESAVTEVSSDGDHYTLTVDSKTWFSGLAEGSMYRQMELPDEISMDLYVDDDSLPVRLAFEVPGQPESSARIGFTDWGTPVEVAVPRRAKPFTKDSA